VLLDWLHLVAGSLWIGGLIGLLVLWWSLPAGKRVPGLAVCVPRFSDVAFVSVLLLIASGTGASILHLPTLGSLWQTSYGEALLVKVGILALAGLPASVNLLRNKPRLHAYERRPDLAPGAAGLLGRLVSVEAILVAGAVFVAAILSSLAPPPKALAQEGGAVAHVGPGPVTRVVERNGYRLAFRITPNRAAVPTTIGVAISRGGKPVRGADVTATFTMLDMEMGQQAYQLAETRPGVYEHSGPALVMVGHWGVSFDIEPRGSQPFTVLLVDHATG
jgi:copper transport protein